MTDIMTPEEFIEHHGVMGMKWGVHKKEGSSSAGGKIASKKKITSGDIYNARSKTASRQRALNQQVDKTNLAHPGKAQAREAKKLNEMSLEFLKNPDRATAQRLTVGEKVGLAVLAVAVPGIGTAAAGGAVAARVGIRKATERDIRNAKAGKYNS